MANNKPLSGGNVSGEVAEDGTPFLSNGSVVLDAGSVVICTGCPCTNTQWKKCSDDTDLVVFSPEGQPSQVVAWVFDAISGNFVKAYEADPTTDVATDPCFVETQGTPFTLCSELTPNDWSDNFLKLVIDTCRWDANSVLGTGSSLTQGGGNMNYVCGSVSAVNNVTLLTNSFPDDTGDIQIDVPWSLSHGVGSSLSGFNLGIAGAFGTNQITKQSVSGVGRIRASFNGAPTDFATSVTSGIFRISRVSGTLAMAYDIGGGFVTLASGAEAGTLTGIQLDAFNDNPTTNVTTVTVSDCTITNAA